jgi:hypothetical protein
VKLLQRATLLIPFALSVLGGLHMSPARAADDDTQILLVATFHLSNPGRDLHNVAVDDVLLPKRQAEIKAAVDALAKFKPDRIGVEWPAAVTDERYAQYREGKLEPSRNEVVQLGFALAKARGLDRVYGLDVDGDFPFGPVMEWAKANGRSGVIDAAMAAGAAEVAHVTDMVKTKTIGGVLRYMNTDAAIAANHAFYPPMLRMGAGDAQPGVDLIAAWTRRNLAICAKLLQTVQPGERVVVFFGQGHVHLLRQCLSEQPGVTLVDPLRYLPR